MIDERKTRHPEKPMETSNIIRPKLVCDVCGLGPLDGRALYREKGALFNNGKSRKAVGPHYCMEHAPRSIQDRVRHEPTIVDLATARLAGVNR
jgi:hypothetical protein